MVSTCSSMVLRMSSESVVADANLVTLMISACVKPMVA